jgi:molybdopterin molybdotransferase
MINYLDALAKTLEQAKDLPRETVSVRDAINRVSAEDVAAQENVPGFDNSAMDGFAVCSKDTKTACENAPIVLNKIGMIVAGVFNDTAIEAKDKTNTACEIMTGAVLPAGYDAVVRVEDVVREKNEKGETIAISLSKPLAVKENVRYAGEDFKPSDMILRAGGEITPAHLMALLGVGVADVSVRKKPRVVFICTGDELVDDPQQSLKKGQIRNTTGAYLHAFLTSVHAEVSEYKSVPDQKDAFLSVLSGAQTMMADVILSTGAVSMGQRDFIPSLLEQAGAKILFHKVSMRPGKPLLLAKLKNGAYFFGLPGNPISSTVGLRFVVYPFLRKIQGMPAEQPIVGRLTSDVNRKPGLRFFLKAHAFVDEAGQINVDILQGQESFKIKPLLHANCWAVLKEDQEKTGPYKTGDNVDIYPLLPSHSFLATAESL